MLRLLLVSVCFSPTIPLLICNASLIVIGVVAPMIVDQQMVMQSFGQKSYFMDFEETANHCPVFH